MLARSGDTAHAITAGGLSRPRRGGFVWIVALVATLLVAAAVYFWLSLFIVCACVPPSLGDRAASPPSGEGVASLPPAGEKRGRAGRTGEDAEGS